MEIPGDRDLIGGARKFFTLPSIPSPARLREAAKTAREAVPGCLLQLMDSYVLSTFLFYFVLWLAAFVTMSQFYNFFDLLKDVVKNHIALSRVAAFHLFLTPLLIYRTLPVAVLLCGTGDFRRDDEKQRSDGLQSLRHQSVRRLRLPVLLMSGVLSWGFYSQPTIRGSRAQTRYRTRSITKSKAGRLRPIFTLNASG